MKTFVVCSFFGCDSIPKVVGFMTKVVVARPCSFIFLKSRNSIDITINIRYVCTAIIRCFSL